MAIKNKHCVNAGIADIMSVLRSKTLLLEEAEEAGIVQMLRDSAVAGVLYNITTSSVLQWLKGRVSDSVHADLKIRLNMQQDSIRFKDKSDTTRRIVSTLACTDVSEEKLTAVLQLLNAGEAKEEGLLQDPWERVTAILYQSEAGMSWEQAQRCASLIVEELYVDTVFADFYSNVYELTKDAIEQGKLPASLVESVEILFNVWSAQND